MKVFTFGNITKHYWYPVLLSISCYCQFLSKEIYLSVKDIKQINSRKFFMNSIDIFSLITCGILALLSNKSSKSTFERKQRFNFKIILHFLGIITLTCTQIIIANILVVYEYSMIEISKTIQIIICMVLCFFFLKINNYKHHYVAIGVIFIISVIMCGIKLSYNTPIFSLDKLKLFGQSILFYFFYTSMEVYEKFIMKYYFVSPYTLLFFKGICELIIMIGISIVLYCVEDYRKEFLDYSSMVKSPFTIILLFFCCFVLNIFRIQTINIYTPVYRFVADIAAVFFIFITSLIVPNTMILPIGFRILFVLFYIFIFIGIFVFQELIIINVLGMNENTLKQINLRGVTENSKVQKMLEEEVLELEDSGIE